MRGIQVPFVLVVVSILTGRVASAQVTHVGAKPSDHVMLESVGVDPNGTSGCVVRVSAVEFKRNLLDGTTEQTEGSFQVPTGKVLVVTDFDWSYQAENGTTAAGTTQVLRLVVQNIADGHFFPVASSTAILNSEGFGAATESMTGGFVLSSKARLCAAVSPGSEDRLNFLHVRGYLTKEEK